MRKVGTKTYNNRGMAPLKRNDEYVVRKDGKIAEVMRVTQTQPPDAEIPRIVHVDVYVPRV